MCNVAIRSNDYINNNMYNITKYVYVCCAAVCVLETYTNNIVLSFGRMRLFTTNPGDIATMTQYTCRL